jgi:hypothetical protein
MGVHTQGSAYAKFQNPMRKKSNWVRKKRKKAINRGIYVPPATPSLGPKLRGNILSLCLTWK